MYADTPVIARLTAYPAAASPQKLKLLCLPVIQKLMGEQKHLLLLCRRLKLRTVDTELAHQTLSGNTG
ncbi:hypothetical protein D3C81_2229080 [compost metagenome]